MATEEKRLGNKVAIVGCGLVGKSFAMAFASGGYQVCIYDVNPEQISNGILEIKTMLAELEGNGCLRGSLNAEEHFRLISPAVSLEDCLEDAFYVQECVPDHLPLKLTVNAEIDKYVRDDVIIAGSSGALFPSQLSADMKHRSRYVIAHPLNPPHLVPLVEVVPAPWTDQSAVDDARCFLDSVGSVPVCLKKESPGFIICRIQHAITAECFKLVRDGVVGVRDLDKLMPEGLGLRYAFLGALETSYLNARGMAEFCKLYGEGLYEQQTHYGPPIRLEGPVLEEIQRELEKDIPLDKIEERRAWRNERVAALIRLKKEFK